MFITSNPREKYWGQETTVKMNGNTCMSQGNYNEKHLFDYVENCRLLSVDGLHNFPAREDVVGGGWTD